MTVSVRTAIKPPLLGFKSSDVHTEGVPQFAVGTMVECSDGTVWRYVSTTKALAVGSVYRLGSDYAVGNDVQTSDTTSIPFPLGVPQNVVAAPSGVTYNYCWVQTAGAFTYLKCASGTAKDNPLYISSTAGALNSIYSATLGSCTVMSAKYTGASAVTTTLVTDSTATTCFSPVELFVPRELQ